jgi:hypothetical protein
LEIERLEVQFIRPLNRGQRDRQVLDRQAGRVEDRDLVVVPAAWREASEHGTEVRHVLPQEHTLLDSAARVEWPEGLPNTLPMS